MSVGLCVRKFWPKRGQILSEKETRHSGSVFTRRTLPKRSYFIKFTFWLLLDTQGFNLLPGTMRVCALQLYKPYIRGPAQEPFKQLGQ